MLRCFVGTTPETQLIKILLAKSRVLLRILIDTCYLPDKPLDTRSKIFAKVSNFLIASPKAEVVYIDF